MKEYEGKVIAGREETLRADRHQLPHHTVPKKPVGARLKVLSRSGGRIIPPDPAVQGFQGTFS